jgi:hypothetical protein
MHYQHVPLLRANDIHTGSVTTDLNPAPISLAKQLPREMRTGIAAIDNAKERAWNDLRVAPPKGWTAATYPTAQYALARYVLFPADGWGSGIEHMWWQMHDVRPGGVPSHPFSGRARVQKAHTINDEQSPLHGRPVWSWDRFYELQQSWVRTGLIKIESLYTWHQDLGLDPQDIDPRAWCCPTIKYDFRPKDPKSKVYDDDGNEVGWEAKLRTKDEIWIPDPGAPRGRRRPSDDELLELMLICCRSHGRQHNKKVEAQRRIAVTRWVRFKEVHQAHDLRSNPQMIQGLRELRARTDI